MSEVIFRSAMPVSPRELYAWHDRGGAFERLVPPWQHVQVTERTGGVQDGARLSMRLAMGPLGLRWVAVHGNVVPGQEFTDWQESGPFAYWCHRHRCLSANADGVGSSTATGERSVLSDEIEYRLPLEPLSRWLGGRLTRSDLRRMFAFRHRRTHRDLTRHAGLSARPLTLAVTGSSGFIGTALCAYLTTGGHSVRRLVRRPARSRIDGTTEVQWDAAGGHVDTDALEGVDAVVHLAGTPIAARRWSSARMQEIRSSRVEGTRLLCERLAAMPNPPRALVAASGVGFYGDRGEPVDEDCGPGQGYLSDTAREWEAATAPASAAGVRVVNARIGVVLGAAGGMLQRLVPIYRAALGGPLGSGSQPLSWISLDDTIGALHFALVDESLEGPVNIVAPAPATQGDFARTLGHVLRRPAILQVPAGVVRTLYGQMGDALLLGGAAVVPRALRDRGFDFLDTDLEDALRFELGARTMQESES